MFQDKINFKNSKGLSLAGVFEGETKEAPIVVACHGYDSSKDSPSNASLAEEIIKRGISVFRFDFTGNGGSEGDLADLTPKHGLDDLKSVISHLEVRDFGLYGSSFGGHVALMYASENPVAALALRAPVSDYAWVVSGEPSERGKGWIKELRGLNLYREARNISTPTLIVHGNQDETVPVEQSKNLYKALKTDKKLEIIPGASHQFRGEYLERSNKLVADFLQENLLK